MSMQTPAHNADVSLAQEFKKHLYNASRQHGILDHGRKKGQVKNWTNRKYHVQNNEDVEQQDAQMYCDTTQCTKFLFISPHKKPHGLRRLSKNYHVRFYTKTGHVICAIHHITCTCTPLKTVS